MLHIRLDMFEGPLDLLLHLIEKQEVDIYDVSISLITKQYVEVLEEAHALELEITSEFLVMASTLISIKSRMLLPIKVTAEEEMEDSDPREAFIQRLLEYKKYKYASMTLAEKEKERLKVYSPLPLDFTSNIKESKPYAVMSGDKLYEVFVSMLKTKNEEEKPYKKLEREEVSVSDCINIIVNLLENEELSFSTLCSKEGFSKEWLVSMFLALLELVKQKRVVLNQYGLFKDIYIQGVTNEVAI